MTKNDLYALLIQEGVERGFCVIPEYFFVLPDGRTKELDLVWATRRRSSNAQDATNAQYWRLWAAFEIEGCNVRNLKNEFARHVLELPHVHNDDDEPICLIVVLYTAAYDRNWKNEKDRDKEVSERQQWAAGQCFQVVDGRRVNELLTAIEHVRIDL